MRGIHAKVQYPRSLSCRKQHIRKMRLICLFLFYKGLSVFVHKLVHLSFMSPLLSNVLHSCSVTKLQLLGSENEADDEDEDHFR